MWLEDTPLSLIRMGRVNLIEGKKGREGYRAREQDTPGKQTSGRRRKRTSPVPLTR